MKMIKKTGVWQFYDNENELIQEFDFDPKQMVHNDSLKNRGAFLIKSGPYKGLNFLDNTPQFTAGDHALFDFIRENIVLTNEIKEKHLTVVAYVQFTILENGEVNDIKIFKSFMKNLTL